jgi:hypothetical protein
LVIVWQRCPLTDQQNNEEVNHIHYPLAYHGQVA